MKNFRALQQAIHCYQLSCQLKLPSYLQNQLERAASSVALNLAEGRGKATRRDQLRFFHIALGSVREMETILQLAQSKNENLRQQFNYLAASVYLLIKHAR